jgi:O-antigen/teichoic acid export membrane protein
MILGYLSDREVQLGCYSVAVMVTTQLFGLGNMLSMVMGPRYAECFGRYEDRRSVAGLAARASELQAAAMALPAALALVAAAPILGRLLPDYRSGLPPLMYLVPGVVLVSLALPGSQYLVAVGRQRRALAAVLLGTALAALGNHLALSAGYGLIGVAAATAVAYGVYYLMIAAVSFWIELDCRGRVRYVAMIALALGPTLTTAVLLESLSPEAQDDWRSVLLKIVAVSAVWVITVVIGWHAGGWREKFRSDSQQAV